MTEMADNPEVQTKMESILDEIQSMPYEQWYGHASEDEGTDHAKGDNETNNSQDVLYADLAETAVRHELCPVRTKEESKILHGNAEDPEFDGTVMDHGAQNTVGGQQQYEAYCRHTKLPMAPLAPSDKTFKFGNRATKSLGIAMIRFPTDNEGSFFEYPSDIVPIDVPLLFGLDLMKRYRIRIDEVDNKIEQREQGWSAKLVFKKGHLYREWPTSTIKIGRAHV